MTSSTLDIVRDILRDTLQLGERAAALRPDSPLFGSLPELDSMAVVEVITSIEDRLDILVDDEDISAETFETLGSLSRFVDDKLAE